MTQDRSEMSEDDDDQQSPPLDLPSTAIADPCSSSSSPNKSRNCISNSQTFPDHVLENVLENVLQFLDSRCDRNAASLVCKSWWRVEALTRSEVFIGNCYALSPARLTQRFKRVRSLVLKGKPRFADFNLMPPDWGANFAPWVSTMAQAYPCLEKVDLKRMFVTDDDLALLADSFPGFKELILVCCEGFGTSGISIVANKCRKLKVLDLIESEVTDDEVDWISCFPEDVTCLESLAFDCVEAPINFKALEGLVARSPFLKKLRLNRFVSLVELHRLLLGAPQLTSLGTGSFSHDEEPQSEQEPDYAAAFRACKSVVCLSGFRELMPEYLPAIFPVCANLTSLNFSYANISPDMFKPIILNCHKLQVFWALDSICDEGLQAVAATCKELRELRIFPFDPREDSEGPVSELGLQAISEGCRKLESILYFCQRMTNAAVIAMSENCPELTVFRLCIMGRHRPDHVTGKPMDEGFGAIVKNCKKLTRLAVSGLLTDQAFRYMGEYGNRFIQDMSMEPNERVWGALLGACRVHSDTDIGLLAADKLFQLAPEQSGYYVLLSNIYAKAGRWEEVTNIRNIMKSKGLKKNPGASNVEVNRIIHTFLVGDRSHPQSDEIYRELDVLVKKMKELGYVPDSESALHDVEEEDKETHLAVHSEKLAIVFALMNTKEEEEDSNNTIRITKNLRICGDCHVAAKLISQITSREIIIRDTNRFHVFRFGVCSCGDYW